MKILGCIIAGGASRRMEREKGFTHLGGRPLISRVAERLLGQVDALTVNANGNADRMAFLKVPVFADRLVTGSTPLAGVHAALHHAQNAGFDAVLSVPSDTPFLPLDLRSRLEAGAPAIAASQGQEHYLTGLWPVSLLPRLEVAIMQQSLRRMWEWAALVEAKPIDWAIGLYDPFFNVNTPADLAQAETYLALSEKR